MASEKGMVLDARKWGHQSLALFKVFCAITGPTRLHVLGFRPPVWIVWSHILRPIWNSVLLLVSEFILYFSRIVSVALHSLPFFPKSLHAAGFNRVVERGVNTKEIRSAHEKEAFDLSLHCWQDCMQFAKHPIYDFASDTPGECLLSRNYPLRLTLYNTCANTRPTWAFHKYFRRGDTVVFPNTLIQQFQHN